MPLSWAAEYELEARVKVAWRRNLKTEMKEADFGQGRYCRLPRKPNSLW